jgi:hypothetical protein
MTYYLLDKVWYQDPDVTNNQEIECDIVGILHGKLVYDYVMLRPVVNVNNIRITVVCTLDALYNGCTADFAPNIIGETVLARSTTPGPWNITFSKTTYWMNVLFINKHSPANFIIHAQDTTEANNLSPGELTICSSDIITDEDRGGLKYL